MFCQLAETRLFICQGQQHTGKQQQISGIRNTCSCRIIIDGQDGALFIGIIGGLVEPVSTNLHTVVQAVQAGMGISVLSPVLMREELAAGTLREIPVEDFAEVREISAAVRRGRSDYAPLERFLDFCQEQSAQL